MIKDRFEATYSAPILLYSIPFGEFSKEERLADKGDWAPLRATMVDAAKRLEAGGADFIIVASNTMNSTDDLIEANVGIPVLNIVDAVGGAVQDRGLKTVALLGTKYTMEEEFYRGRPGERLQAQGRDPQRGRARLHQRRDLQRASAWGCSSRSRGTASSRSSTDL